ncbi:hypothetical protein EDD90_1859 [Streptomyces sp. Ag109_O5-1]|uniref:hypothetical protein n=1 Tax=Streptomyces sp. Ag109_O5-1 TaxID=1938851 RepID=UPI000F4F76FC|nr:hypothetical protein [Streptomyces sp. Ag109_O5-1]RPE38918.1 hypothetical protein EDD90_1859 [Streptomyces sp. Ag109_O5-1]
MTEKNEKLKPPARRTGRTLGGGAKNAAPPPPPPAAELTPEQYAAEQPPARATAQAPEGVPGASPVPVLAHVAAAPAQVGTEHDAYPVAADSAAASTPNAAAPAAAESPSPQTVATTAGPVPLPAAQAETPAAAPVGFSEHSATKGSVATAADVPIPGAVAEIAVRATAPVVTGTAFPVEAKEPTREHSHGARAQEAPSEGVPWTQGPGRPQGIPDVAVVLNQRIITRESLDSSVPAALKLKKRIKRFALDNELDHLPLGDIVAVAMDEWLSTRGF